MSTSGPSNALKLPLSRGKVLVFDHTTGRVCIVDSFPSPWVKGT